MSLLNRRRMMVDNKEEDWDFVYHYTMGDPLDNGFKLPDGAQPNDPFSITSQGLYFNYRHNNGLLYQIVPENYIFCNEGVYELKVKITHNGAHSGQGVRLQLSNGINGTSIYLANNNTIYYATAVTVDTGCKYNYNEWIKIKIKLLNNTSYIYLNDNIIYQNSSLSNIYMTSGNRILVQGLVECYIESIKFKKIS